MFEKVIDLIESNNFLHYFELVDYARKNDFKLFGFVSKKEGVLFCSAYLDSRRNSLENNLDYQTLDLIEN